MSVFGGDSWGREAQYRKRRVDDLITDGIDTSAYKKLSNGKFACLVCPHYPIIDTPLMLSTHMKGSRHRAAATKLKEREVVRVNESNKRIVLSDSSTVTSSTSSYHQERRSTVQPLIEQTRKAASEILGGNNSQCSAIKERQDVPSGIDDSVNFSSTNSKGPYIELEAARKEALHQQIVYHCLEKELKFTASGWKRDCHGRWFKDENVEFDSDEEDPNVCFAQ